MVDVAKVRCSCCRDVSVSNKAYEGLCFRCFVLTYPDRDNFRNYKTKERTVAEHIVNTFPHQKWVLDKTVDGGISKRRPDVSLELDSQVLIIEIDENQHKSYDCSCENKRLMEISLDYNHKSIVFIRFNPDDYMIDGKKIVSPWIQGYGDKGLLTIDKDRKTDWESRLFCLTEQINYWLINNTSKTIETIQLFYDQ